MWSLAAARVIMSNCVWALQGSLFWKQLELATNCCAWQQAVYAHMCWVSQQRSTGILAACMQCWSLVVAGWWATQMPYKELTRLSHIQGAQVRSSAVTVGDSLHTLTMKYWRRSLVCWNRTAGMQNKKKLQLYLFCLSAKQCVWNLLTFFKVKKFIMMWWQSHDLGYKLLNGWLILLKLENPNLSTDGWIW